MSTTNQVIPQFDQNDDHIKRFWTLCLLCEKVDPVKKGDLVKGR